MSCSIPGDPDIAGLGVRIAVYAQAFLCMLPSVLLALFGPEPDGNYAAVVAGPYHQGRATVTNLLITNVALLIVSLYKVAAGTLTRYHGALILHLNWIVFLSALSSAITLAYSHPLRNKPGFMAWLRLVLLPVIHRDRNAVLAEIYGSQGLVRSLLQSRVHWSKILHSEHHFIFLSIHIFGIGILGVILFGNSNGFARHVECDRDVVLWVFDDLLPISGPAIQHFWFAIYAISLVPVANIIVCAIFVVFVCASPVWLALACLRFMSTRFRGLPGTVTRLVIVLPFLAIITILIASTQETIAANRSSDAVGPEEDQWGFGQILAIVLLVAPAVETFKRVLVIFTARPVVFPKFPARDADEAPYADLCRQHARRLAARRCTQWLARVSDSTSIKDHNTFFQLPSDISGKLHVPVVVSAATINGATTDQVFGVIVPTGMRKEWDSALDFDGVLKRYDADTVQRYVVTRPERLASDAPIKPRDFVLVQHVMRPAGRETTIFVTLASMGPKESLIGGQDHLPEQPGRVRAELHFEGWVIEPVAGGTRLTCVSRLTLEDTLPLATARDMIRRSLLYPSKVRWTLLNYGFAPVWDMRGTHADDVAVLEFEHMDPESGKYTATFRTRAAGDVTVMYDVEKRINYEGGAHISWELIEGSRKNLTASRNSTEGRLILTVGAAGMSVTLTIFRSLRFPQRHVGISGGLQAV